MNIQIFGKTKCFETQKAERWFKERGIKFQSVDVKNFGMSRGELISVSEAVGLNNMADPSHPNAPLFARLASDSAKLSHLMDDSTLLRTPIVRNGRQATLGYCPIIWSTWK